MALALTLTLTLIQGASDFKAMADTLTSRGIPTVVVPMPVWHWLPCLGGRSMRPMLERIDHTVRLVTVGARVRVGVGVWG